MNGWQVLGWAGIAAIVIIIEGFAAGLVAAFIRSATRSVQGSGSYKSRSHE